MTKFQYKLTRLVVRIQDENMLEGDKIKLNLRNKLLIIAATLLWLMLFGVLVFKG